MMRVAVIHDLFRSPALGIGSCVTNARWIEALFKVAVEGLPVTVTRFAGRADGGSIDESAVLRTLGLPATPEGWARLTNVAELQSVPALEPLFEADLVIGFGLTSALVRAFAARNVPVVDVEISPLRFGPSLPFRVRTSHTGLCDIFSKIVAERTVLESAAQSHIGRSAALNDHAEDPGTWGLFCGQTHLDLSLVVDGKLVSPEQDESFERIRALAGAVDVFHIAAHPFTAERPSQLRRLFADIPNAVPAERSTYAYLASRRLDFVTSLSSSVLSEAPWFGVAAKRIIVPDRDREERLPPGVSAWMDVDGRLFSRELWTAFVRGTPFTPFPNQPHVNPADVHFMKNLGGSTTDVVFSPLPELAADCRNVIAPGVPHAAMLRAGWHDPEHWGRWSNSEFSSLMFRSDSNEALDVVLEASTFMNVEVQCRPFGTVGFTPLVFGGSPDKPTAVVRAKPGPNGICGIIFRAPVMLSPSLFDGADARRLGLALRAVTLQDIGGGHSGEAEGRARQVLSPGYYRTLHQTVVGYQTNNWLLPYAAMVRRLAPKTLVECGCGNGDFLSSVSDRVESLIGLDWAGSAGFPFSARGIRLHPWNALHDDVPKADMVCSADFLEHIPPDAVDEVLAKLISAAPKQFHVIACYDDFHSHLTIDPPERWLERFRALDKSFFLLERIERSGGREAASFANFQTSDS